MLGVYVHPAQLKLFSFCFHLMLQYQGLSLAQWLYFWVYFFNCQQMYYKWCRAAERLVVCTVLMAMTLLFFINVLLGKNKLNKVSWLSFGHLFPTHSLSAAWLLVDFYQGTSLVEKMAIWWLWTLEKFVVFCLTEPETAPYLQRFPLLVLLVASYIHLHPEYWD